MNGFAHQWIWPKNANGLLAFVINLTNFENNTVCGSAANFGPDSGLSLFRSSDRGSSTNFEFQLDCGKSRLVSGHFVHYCSDESSSSAQTCNKLHAVFRRRQTTAGNTSAFSGYMPFTFSVYR